MALLKSHNSGPVQKDYNQIITEVQDNPDTSQMLDNSDNCNSKTLKLR